MSQLEPRRPLGEFNTLVKTEGEDQLKAQKRQFRTSVKKHIDDIAAKYIVPGETSDETDGTGRMGVSSVLSVRGVPALPISCCP